MAEGLGRYWLLWLCLCLGACLSGNSHASDQNALHLQALELRDARATVVVDGRTEQRQLSLPYHWDRNNPGRAGSATFDLAFTLPESPAQPWSIYLPRLGNAYEVWLNGTLVQHEGRC